jgi:hypothetical protein
MESQSDFLMNSVRYVLNAAFFPEVQRISVNIMLDKVIIVATNF